MGDILSDTISAVTALLGVKLEAKGNSNNAYNNARRHRNREERFTYLESFVLRQYRVNLENQHRFQEIGQDVRTLLHDAYDFRVRFALSPDTTTSVNAQFSSGLGGTFGKNDLSFTQLGTGEASVRLNEENYIFKAALCTADMGSMNALFRMGTKESNCYVRGITNLDTAEVGLFGGAALRTHQYAFNFEIDALNPSHKINATGVYRVGENITIGARYRTVAGAVGPQTKQVLDTKLSLRNESLDSVNAQPQDYEITASVLDNGTTLSTAYLYNMMMPIGGRLHRFSMGGEFVRHGTENVLVETKARMGLTAPRVPSRLLPRSPEPPRSPRPASWAPGTKGYERQLRSSSAAPNKDAGSGSTSMRPRSESAAVEPRELQHNQYVSRTNPSSHHLTAGVSWQPSEAIMIKLRADQATNVGVLLALKTWARNGPNVTVALSMRVNAQNPNAYRAGMFVDFHN